MLLCFFFFKQKTAYEMRISDWSSDVCSSVLRVVAGTADEGVVAFLAEDEVVATAGVDEVVAARATAAGAERFAVEVVGRLVGRVAQEIHDLLQIGRA